MYRGLTYIVDVMILTTSYEISARLFGIWIVFAVGIAVGVEGVALNNACTVDGTACATTNAECRDDGAGLLCLCEATYYEKSDGTCISQIALDDTCLTGQTDAQCADSLAECVEDSGLKCKCKAANYNNGGTCAAKIALNEACTASPADQCLANGECSSLTCACSTNFFANKDGACAAVVSGLDGACDETDPAAGQCTYPDTECILDTTGKCKCKAATHYLLTTTCTLRKNPDEDCTAVGQCVTNAECDTADTDKCKCNAGYTATPTTTPTMCSGVVKFASLSYMYVVPIIVSMMSLLR